MALPFPINANQTDAKSPIDQQLMDAFRLNQEYLDSQIGAGGAGGLLNFRVNGSLIRIRETLDLGSGQRVDGGIITSPITFSKATLYLEKGGLDGALEVDVVRHKEVQHAIEKIESQYSESTQSIGRLGSPLNTQAISQATPQIDTQLITKPKSTVNIESIADLGSSNFLYTFSGTTLLDADYEIGDYIEFSGCTNAANDGEYQILQINYDGLPSVLINNPSGVEQSAAAGTGQLSLYEFTYLSLVDDDFTAGEEVIMAGHTDGGNNGTRTIYKTNQGGNNIWLKYAGGATQGAAAGTADCTRWVYVFSVQPDDTQYIVGEKAEFSGHTSGNNNGKFIIRRVNEGGGNNLYVTNPNGVTQGGAGGTSDTLRWLLGLPADPTGLVEVGDKIVSRNNGNANNDGTFTVTFVKRFTVNNIEIYNENGVAEPSAVGDILHTYKIVSFKEDLSAFYIVDTSLVALEGLKEITGDTVPEYQVKEINRGGGANYNIVIDAEVINEQLVTSGRVAREIRTIFIDRPRIEVAQPNVVRNLQKDDTATFQAGAVEGNTILTMNIIEVPQGLPATMLLSLS